MIGSARDIVEELGIPRFLFTDLPLGNPIGQPNGHVQQRQTMREALALAESATTSKTTLQASAEWTGTPDWRETYMDISDVEQLRQLGEARRERQRRRKEDSAAF